MMTKQKLAQTRAGQTRGRGRGSRSRRHRHRPPRERWEEARGGRRPQNRIWRTSRQTTQGRRRGRVGADAGRDERRSRTLRRDQQEDVRRDRSSRDPGTRGTTCGRRPVLVPHREDDATTPASRRPPPTKNPVHKDRMGGDLLRPGCWM